MSLHHKLRTLSPGTGGHGHRPRRQVLMVPGGCGGRPGTVRSPSGEHPKQELTSRIRGSASPRSWDLPRPSGEVNKLTSRPRPGLPRPGPEARESTRKIQPPSSPPAPRGLYLAKRRLTFCDLHCGPRRCYLLLLKQGHQLHPLQRFWGHLFSNNNRSRAVLWTELRAPRILTPKPPQQGGGCLQAKRRGLRMKPPGLAR